MTPSSTPRGSLIARLEDAEVGSRELDAEIAAALDGWSGFGLRTSQIEGRPRGSDRFSTPPHYTTSLDAALALVERVLPGWWPGFQKNRGSLERKRWAAWLDGPHHSGVDAIEVSAATAPLALCIALLKALEAQPKDQTHEAL